MGNPINVAQTIGQIPTLQESIRLEINQNQIQPHANANFNRLDMQRWMSTVVEIDQSMFRRVRDDEHGQEDEQSPEPAENIEPPEVDGQYPQVDIVV